MQPYLMALGCSGPSPYTGQRKSLAVCWEAECHHEQAHLARFQPCTVHGWCGQAEFWSDPSLPAVPSQAHAQT